MGLSPPILHLLRTSNQDWNALTFHIIEHHAAQSPTQCAFQQFVVLLYRNTWTSLNSSYPILARQHPAIIKIVLWSLHADECQESSHTNMTNPIYTHGTIPCLLKLLVISKSNFRTNLLEVQPPVLQSGPSNKFAGLHVRDMLIYLRTHDPSPKSVSSYFTRVRHGQTFYWCVSFW